MFKMSAFSVHTGQQTTPPLVDLVVHNILVQFAPHGAHRSGDVINLIIVACRISSRLKQDAQQSQRPRCRVHYSFHLFFISPSIGSSNT